jgi:hypothetical protein
MSTRNIRIQCADLPSHYTNVFLPEVQTPRHGGRIPDWDEEDSLPSPPPLERITTRYPNLELEAEYESAMEPVHDNFHWLMEERWVEHKKVLDSARYDTEIRKILVDILGGPKKDDLLDKLLGKVSTAKSENDLKVCAYKYKRIETKCVGDIPKSIWDAVLVEGDDVWRPRIHTLFHETDLLDRFMNAFGKNFTHQMKSRVVEETDCYTLYEESLILGYHPGLSQFMNGLYEEAEIVNNE